MANEKNTERGGIATFNLVVAANERRVVGARGTFLRVKDAGVPLTITTRSTKIGSGDGRAFANEMKKFEKVFTDTEFDEVVVEHSSADAQTIILQIGYGDYEAEIISRTLASNSIVAGQATGYVDDTTEPRTPASQVATIPENLQRKRIKIRIFIDTVTEESVIGAPDIWFTLKSDDVPPNSLADTDYVPVGWVLGVSTSTQQYMLQPGDYVWEMEYETTAAIYIGAVIVGGSYTGFALDYRVMYVEEVYSAA